MNLKNASNAYVGALAYADPKTGRARFDVFDDIPKTVWAAIAVSALTDGGDRISEARDEVLMEWRALHENGIVPQAPPKRLLALLAPQDDEHNDLSDDVPASHEPVDS